MSDEVIIPGQQVVETPEGDIVAYQVGGRRAYTNQVLPANGVWQTEWLKRESYNGAKVVIFSDRNGTYKIEYSDDAGETLSMPSVPVPYNIEIGTRKGVFDISAEWVRFTYTNGNQAQTAFKFEVNFLTQIAQPSMENLGALGADSRLAMWTKTQIETKDASGAWGKVNRTGDALNTYLENIDTLATKDVQLDLLAALTALQDGLEVTVANPQDTSDLATEQTISDIKSILSAGINVLNNPDYATNATITQALAGVLKVDIQDTDYAKDSSLQGLDVVLKAIRDKITVGAATESTLNAIANKLINGTLAVNTISGFATELTLQAIRDKLLGTIAVTGQFYPSTQPVSLATNTPDVTDRANRVLGHVVVDNTVPVSGTVNANVTFPATQAVSGTVTANVTFPATQPVSLASNTPDVTDRATRVLGHVVVDNTVPVSGTVNANVNFPATQAVSGTVNANVTFPATQQVSGTVTANVTFPTTQPVSGNVTVNTITGYATEATQAAGNVILGSTTDAANTNPTATAAMNANLKGLLSLIATTNTSLASLISTQIGFSTAATQTTVAASTTGVQALAANSNRKNAVITNTTSVAVNIYYGTATTSRVATLTAIGQYWEMNPDLYKGVITVKSSSGTPLLEVVETT